MRHSDSLIFKEEKSVQFQYNYMDYYIAIAIYNRDITIIFLEILLLIALVTITITNAIITITFNNNGKY